MVIAAQLLQHACDHGEIVYMVYNGGSHAGKLRPIIPLLVGVNTVLAREPGALQEQCFELEKIAYLALQDGRAAAD